MFFIKFGKFQTLFLQIFFILFCFSLFSFLDSYYAYVGMFVDVPLVSVHFSSFFLLFSMNNLNEFIFKFIDSFFWMFKSTTEPLWGNSHLVILIFKSKISI